MIDRERDRRWTKAVLEHWEKCIHCNDTETLQAHHVIPRGNMRTRYVLENGFPTCHKLHRLFEKSRKDAEKQVTFYLGRDVYQNLLAISRGKAEPEDFGYTVIK
jgi:hypothetical protein